MEMCYSLVKYSTLLQQHLMSFLHLCSAVEFPAVLLNIATGAVEEEFQWFIQPQENTTLSAFCTQLTGISQVRVCAHMCK